MPLNRRKLLCYAGCSTGLALMGCGSQTGSPPTGPVSAGNISALAVGALIVLSNVAVGRDADGVYGMSAVCTHAGCFLADASQTIAAGLGCGCHGSTFDGNGNVTRGPAIAPLQHYQVTIAADGGITVDGSQPVAPTTRTPVAS